MIGPIKDKKILKVIGKKPTIKAPRNISPIVAIQYNKPHWKKLVGIANMAEKTIRNPPIVAQKELISHNGYLAGSDRALSIKLTEFPANNPSIKWIVK